MSVEEFRYLFGAMTIINLGVLVFYVLCIMIMGDFAANIHSKMFNVEREKLPKIYFKFIASYKILFIFFNLVPYIAFCYIG